MKKKPIFLFVFAALYSAFSLAQPGRKIDSLLIILKDQKEDTNRVNTLNDLSRNYYLMRNDSLSIRYAGDAIVLAEKLDFKKGCVLGYTNLGFNYQSLDNYSEAMKNFLAALKKAQEGSRKDLVAMAYNNLGWAHFNQSNPNEALKNFKMSAEISLQIGDKREAANAYYNIGNAYYSPLSNFTEAIKAQTISLKLSQEAGDKNKVAGRYIDLGNNYESLGNYPEAIKNYLAALKLSEELGMKGNMGSAYNNIGEIYSDQGNYEEALKYYLAGLKLFEEVKSKRGITDSYSNIGGIYEKQGNFTEAMKYHLAALKLNQEMKWPYGMGYSYGDIGELYFAQSNYAEALKNFLTSLNYFKQIEEIEGSAKTNVRIGETYFRMNNFPEARKYLNEALSAAQQFQGKKIIIETYEILSRVDSATGDWEQAYEDQKLFASYHDSLLNEENSKKIMENMVQYEFGKKEDSLKYQQVLTDEKLKQQTLLNREDQQSLLLKENELVLVNKEKQLQQLRLQKNVADYAVQKAETEKKQNQLGLLNKEKDIQSLQIKRQKLLRNYLLLGLGIFIILSFIVYNNYRTRQKLKLQTLRNEIASDLHDDVGSTLSSISIFSQMAQQQSKEVIPLLETIGESSRKMLDAMADIVWTIKPENDQFEKIISRMRSFAFELLGAKKIDFEFVADDDVAKMKLPMEVKKNLYLIFKEATNNMAKYAGANKAMFTLKEEKNSLTMLIRDNGKGFDTSQSTNGNGLKNMKKRADEIKAQLLIESSPGLGTTIQLNIAV